MNTETQIPPSFQSEQVPSESFYAEIENMHIRELTRQRDTLFAQLRECQSFIETFPGKITAARLDAKNGLETKYDYFLHAKCTETRLPNGKDSRDELIARLKETAILGYELMERADRIDSMLIEARNVNRDCELGEITRMRAQLSKNHATFSAS